MLNAQINAFMFAYVGEGLKSNLACWLVFLWTCYLAAPVWSSVHSNTWSKESFQPHHLQASSAVCVVSRMEGCGLQGWMTRGARLSILIWQKIKKNEDASLIRA